MSTSLFVVVLVAGILVVLLTMSGSIRVWFGHRRRVIESRLNSELAAETIIRKPEPGSYRGATVAGYPVVNNDGMIALTRRRLVFQALTGKVIEVPVTEIAGIREAEVFKPAGMARRQRLIIQTSSGEISFCVCDISAWINSLATVGARLIAAGDFSRKPNLNVLTVIRKRRRAREIVAIVFTTIGVAFGLAAGISAAVVAGSISASGHGTVVDLSYNGKSYVPTVEFVPPEGAPVRFTGRVGSNPPAFHVGDQVGVRYDPDDPQDASIDTYWQMWALPTFFGIFAAPFLLGGMTFGAVALRGRRQTHL